MTAISDEASTRSAFSLGDRTVAEMCFNDIELSDPTVSNSVADAEQEPSAMLALVATSEDQLRSGPLYTLAGGGGGVL
jgi:hypothetical protein